VWQKLECDSRVNGNVTSQTERCKKIYGTNRGIVVLWRSLVVYKRLYKQEMAKMVRPTSNSPNTDVMRQVRLKAHLRPMTSAARPQKRAPTANPALAIAKMSPVCASATPIYVVH
jgi:hypothetical protein